MHPLLSTFLVFLAAALAVVGLYSLVCDLFLRDRSRINRRVDDEFRQHQRAKAQKSALFKKLDLQALTAAAEEEPALSAGEHLSQFVEQSGLEWTVPRLVMLTAGCWAFAALAGLFVSASLLIALAAGAFGALLPPLVVYCKRRARLDRLLMQIPDAYDLMARVMRAGQSLPQALQAVADEFDQPLAGEFAYCYEQQNLGMSPDVALRDLGRRTGLLEIKILILGVVVQQQTGGNLAQLLENLAGVVRDRLRMHSRIKALTAEGRMQAAVLLVLPPLVFFVMLLFNRNYGSVLFHYPALLVGMGVFMTIGALWIRKIVNFDF